MSEPVTVCSGQLFGYGRRSWFEIRELLAGYTGIWGDLDGMHFAEALPLRAPAYTHLWAWREQVYARVRLDPSTDRHVLGVLAVAGEPPPGGDAVGAVEVTVCPVRGWGSDPRVNGLPLRLREPALRRLVTQGPAPVTFVAPAEDGVRS